jgi:hypothetical protein
MRFVSFVVKEIRCTYMVQNSLNDLDFAEGASKYKSPGFVSF